MQSRFSFLRPRVIPPGDASRVIGEGRSIALSRQRLRRCSCRGLQHCREQPARLGSRGSREQRFAERHYRIRSIRSADQNQPYKPWQGGRKQSSVRRRHGGQDIHRPIRNASSPSRLARSSSWLLPTNPHDRAEIAISLMRVFERLHLFDMGPENGVVRRQFADARLPPGIVCVQIVRVLRHPNPPAARSVGG
jgi:hypothetical protein